VSSVPPLLAGFFFRSPFPDFHRHQIFSVYVLFFNFFTLRRVPPSFLPLGVPISPPMTFEIEGWFAVFLLFFLPCVSLSSHSSLHRHFFWSLASFLLAFLSLTANWRSSCLQLHLLPSLAHIHSFSPFFPKVVALFSDRLFSVFMDRIDLPCYAL